MAMYSRTVLFLVLATITFGLWLKYAGEMTVPEQPLRSTGWKKIAGQKLEDNHAKIPQEWLLPPELVSSARERDRVAGDFIESLLDPDTVKITSTDAPQLVQEMSDGVWTAYQVVSAFCKRAAYAHQLSSLLLEINFSFALDRARALDAYFERSGKLVGPLHGLPVTLKDQFHIQGLETSMAYVGWIGTFEGKEGTGKERNVESELVKELLYLGAVPIGKTTLVQSLWAAETNNNILGYARNPWKQCLSTGGSSGGEAAMQALRGSAFGFGTDIGGSVSMPASYNNIYSFKPSVGRISLKDVACPAPGQMVMPPVAGIMAHSIGTLRLVFKSLLSTEPWLADPYVIPLPWRQDAERVPRVGTRLAFGLQLHDGIVAPHPPVQRALRIVEEALLAKGHKIVAWNGPSNNESNEIHGPIARGDGCPDVFEAVQLSGEPIVPEIRHLFPDRKPKSPLSLVEYEQVVVHMKDYRARYNSYWMSTSQETGTGRPVDAVILPVTPYAAVLPGHFWHSAYTSHINILDYPAVVIPVTFANKSIDISSENYKPMTELDNANMVAYDAEAYDGGPAAVQVIGRRLDEEYLLAIAETVADAVQQYKKEKGI